MNFLMLAFSFPHRVGIDGVCHLSDYQNSDRTQALVPQSQIMPGPRFQGVFDLQAVHHPLSIYHIC